MRTDDVEFRSCSDTSHTSKASHSSHASRSSSKSDLAAKTAALKVKLKYLNVESKPKLEFDRVKAPRRLEMAQANLDAIDEPNFNSNQPLR
ncbi:hypothetical protein DPMN_012062 [Dreissena polymorpha]|uniref:Uncharacterized protein n=1 Tax=Dreissena polymorpha TaxID=45954 RepID=A0A9D4N5A4_DREPO|nr:hypothetical protein DPMN_012062 [Dreissena polymorpha]